MKFQKLKLITLGLATAFALTGCEKEETDSETTTTTTNNTEMRGAEFSYEFNNGMVVESAAYDGSHADNLTGKMELTEKSDNKTEIKVSLMNTIAGKTYHIHAHDAADASVTPNGTPYNESPNSGLFTKMVVGNGGTVSISQLATMNYDVLIDSYSGFFVVHDPLQAVSTTDISTYVIVGSFAREASASTLKAKEFDYDFNTGQITEAFAYDGTHANTLKATLKVQELANGESRLSVWLMNTLDTKTYHIHAHDSADPSTTPNGTPYNESPNTGIFTKMIVGNGSTASVNQYSTTSYADITATYSGFFVVHDPLQAVSTVDPTTYVLLGSFAR